MEKINPLDEHKSEVEQKLPLPKEEENKGGEMRSTSIAEQQAASCGDKSNTQPSVLPRRFNVYQDLPELNRLRGDSPSYTEDEYFDPLPCSFPPHLLLLPITEKNTALIRASVYPNPQEEIINDEEKSKGENVETDKLTSNTIKKLSGEGECDQIQRTSIGIDGKPYALHPSPMESTPTRLGFNKSGKKQCPTRSYSDEITDILLGYFVSYREHPYPSQKDQSIMSQKCGLTSQQVRNWFVNIRKRHYYPLIKGQREPRNYLDCLIYSKQEGANEEFKWHTIFGRSAQVNPNPTLTNLNESPVPKVSTKRKNTGRKRPLNTQSEDITLPSTEMKYIYPANGSISNQTTILQPSSSLHPFPTSHSDINLHSNVNMMEQHNLATAYQNYNISQLKQTPGRTIVYSSTSSPDRQPQSQAQSNQTQTSNITTGQPTSQISNTGPGAYSITNHAFPSGAIAVVNYPAGGIHSSSSHPNLLQTPQFAAYPSYINTVNQLEEYPTNKIHPSTTVRTENRQPKSYLVDQNNFHTFGPSSISTSNFAHVSSNGNLAVGVIDNNVKYPSYHQMPMVPQKELSYGGLEREVSIEMNGNDNQNKKKHVTEKEVRMLTTSFPQTNNTIFLSRNTVMDDKTATLAFERDKSRSNSMVPDGLYYDEEESNFSTNDARKITNKSHSIDNRSSSDHHLAFPPLQNNTNLQMTTTNAASGLQHPINIHPNVLVYQPSMYQKNESSQIIPLSSSISVRTNSQTYLLHPHLSSSGISNMTQINTNMASTSSPVDQANKSDTSIELKSSGKSFVKDIPNRSNSRSRAQAMRRQRERLGRQSAQGNGNEAGITNSSRNTSSTQLSVKDMTYTDRKGSDHSLSANSQIQGNEGETKNIEMRSSVSSLSLSLANTQNNTTKEKLSLNSHTGNEQTSLEEMKSSITKDKEKVNAKMQSIESSGTLSTEQTLETHSTANTKISPLLNPSETKNAIRSDMISRDTSKQEV